MKHGLTPYFLGLFFGAGFAWLVTAEAAPKSWSDVIDFTLSTVRASLTTTLAGEDVLNDVQKVESRFNNLPTGATTAMFSADIPIKNAQGFVHAMTCYSDATATAGTIALLDNTAAGAGNVLWSFDVLAIAYNTPFTVPLDVPFSIGLYADFTTTADMKCMVTYR